MFNQHQKLLQRSVDTGNCTYELLEHVSAVLYGVMALASAPDKSDRVKVVQMTKTIRAALHLAHDSMVFIDCEVEELKKLLPKEARNDS